MSDRNLRSLACETALKSLRETVATYATQIPLQKGIFVGNEDRAEACMGACRLLMASEIKNEALRKELSMLASKGDAALCEKWCLFYGQTITAFFVRFETAADLSQNGEGCNPSLLISLCRDFCEAADLFLKQEADSDR